MRKLVVIVIVAVLAVGGTVAAQSTQRFPDVPPDHPDYDAVQWAAEVGVTTGHTDGTFRPEQPLSLRHTTVFLTRYYEEILGADVSADFTRSDMMRVLYEMAGAPGQGSSSSDGEEDSGDAGEQSPDDTTWRGTSTFDGEPSTVVCGRGPTEFSWTLDNEDGKYRWVTLLIWSPPDRQLEIGVTGPNGATKDLVGTSHGEYGSFSFGDDANTDIDVGATSFSVTPLTTLEEALSGQGELFTPSPDAVWGLAGFRSSQPGTSSATTKLRQQWALSVNCDSTE